MEQHHIDTKAPQPPLSELIQNSDEVEVNEVSPENRQRVTATLDRFARDCNSEKNQDGHRAFVVFVKPPPQKTKKEAPSQLPQNRDYLLKNAKILLQNGEYVLARNTYSFLLENSAASSTEKTKVLTPVKRTRFKINSKFDKLKISKTKNVRWWIPINNARKLYCCTRVELEIRKF